LPKGGNTRALGSTSTLQTAERTHYRQIKAASGCISGDPAGVHFGFPDGAQLDWLAIHWPDGQTSIVEDFGPGRLLRISRE